MKTLIYLHGFNSSSQSHKATLTRDWLQQHYPEIDLLIPQLPDNPHRIPDIVDTLAKPLSEKGRLLGFIGSSMGGFFSNVFAEKYSLPAVLINPAVYPHRLLADYLGPQTNPYTGIGYTLDASMIAPLQDMLVQPRPSSAPRLVLVQTEDEVLDYRDAEAFYQNCDLHIEQGGDHSFQGYENWLPKIARFFNL